MEIPELTKENFDQIRKILLDAPDDLRVETALNILNSRKTDFLPLISNLVEMEESASMRATFHYILAVLGPKNVGDQLIVLFEEEENDLILSTMKDSILLFLNRHNIPAENITVRRTIDPRPRLNNEMHSTLSTRQIADFTKEEETGVPTKSTDHDMETSNKVLRELKKILIELTPNLPISLQRLSDLTAITEDSLSDFLLTLTEKNPSAGRFYPLEQIFIKYSTSVAAILDRISNIPLKICDDCEQEALHFPCEHCGGGNQCQTCKLLMGKYQEKISCPSCGRSSHRDHLIKWLKISSQCPSCKVSLNVLDFIED